MPIYYYFPIQNCPWLCILTSLFVYEVAEIWGKDQLREELVRKDKTMHPLGWKFILCWVQVDTANACSKFWNNPIYWSTLGFLNLQFDFPNSVGREHRRKSLEDLMWWLSLLNFPPSSPPTQTWVCVFFSLLKAAPQHQQLCQYNKAHAAPSGHLSQSEVYLEQATWPCLTCLSWWVTLSCLLGFSRCLLINSDALHLPTRTPAIAFPHPVSSRNPER